MEKQIHDLIMPLSEKLIKQLSQLLEKPEHRSPSLFGIELMVYKLLAAMALELMGALIVLLFARGYQASPTSSV